MRAHPIGIFCFCILICLCACLNMGAHPPASNQNSSQKQDAVNPEAIQGCYDLTLSPWFPEMKLGEDEEFITPPTRIQLFAERGTDFLETNGYIVRPAPGVKPSIHRSSYWMPKRSKSIEIVWTTGLSGLTMVLKTSDAEVLHGKAQTFWDFDRKKQTAEVVARRVECEKKQDSR